MLQILWFVLIIALYPVVTYYNYRILKSRVDNWSSNMGYAFWLGIGRDKFIFISLRDDEIVKLKKRLASYGEEASDHDLRLFFKVLSGAQRAIRHCRRYNDRHLTRVDLQHRQSPESSQRVKNPTPRALHRAVATGLFCRHGLRRRKPAVRPDLGVEAHGQRLRLNRAEGSRLARSATREAGLALTPSTAQASARGNPSLRATRSNPDSGRLAGKSCTVRPAPRRAAVI